MIFNPSSEEIEISVDDGNAAKNAGAASKDQFTVPVSSLAYGTYSVKISNGTISETKQLVIKR